jgi:type IV secretion system protein VirD4
MNADAPVSLYVVVPPSDLARMRPVVRLMLNQIGRRLTESMEFGEKTAYRHRLLLLLDEFPSLGKLDFFESSLAFLAGYGLKAFLIAQSLNQLEKAYGPNNVILDNCHIRLTYAANDDKTAKRISDLLGQATERKVQKSYSGSGIFLTHRSESVQEFARPLLTPAEVNQLSQDDGLLLVGGLLPYRARKVRYFLDRRFKGRAGLRPPETRDEQERELPSQITNDWYAVVAEAVDADPRHSSALDAKERNVGVLTEIRPANCAADVRAATDASLPESRSGQVEDAWDGFFQQEQIAVSTNQNNESTDTPSPTTEDLPV